MKTYHWNHKGFTLAEMAIVVLIGSIMLTVGIKILLAQLSNAAYSDTRARQEKVKTALIGFLRTNGRLPCPDTTATPDGLSNGVIEGTCNGLAAAGYGVVPYITLGLSRDDALDGWGNYFTYRVANRQPAGRDWTARTIGTPFDITQLTVPAIALTIQELNAAGTALVNTTTTAVVVVYSHGKNGFGAETSKGNNNAPPPPASVGESTNNTAGTTIFVRRPYSDSLAAFNGPYDDVIMFLSPQDLLQPLVNEGTLKSCYAYCAPAATPTCTGGGIFSCSAGAGFCNGVMPGCTLGGTPTCTTGTSQCAPPATGCAATGIPVGAPNAVCP